MAVALYPHNQTAYSSALRMMETSGKAAVIQPTGTGKAFIAFKLAEEHPGKKILWLAPSEYIFRSQRENYLAAGGEETALEGISFLTYSKVMYAMGGCDDIERMDDTETGVGSENTEKSEKVTGLKRTEETENKLVKATGLEKGETPEYIILDEFHRCGAENWGKSVRTLMDACPNAKVLGLSATNIRYLDSRRDMAGELFDGKIASRMETAEAMAAGILPAPVYICGLYEYSDEFRKISLRVKRQRNAGVRDESEKLLEKLRHSLDCADGPAEIFGKYMKKDGKYIVFCSGREHMEEMTALAGQWYGALDPSPAVYRAIYDNERSPEEVKRFSADRSGHLKLLFCIDMLNEGVHVADVDGAVLLRPTASPTLYLQQVGRALSVPDEGKEAQPVIFDLVDNFDSLRCIDSFLEAYHRAGKAEGEEKTRTEYQFRLIDETRESRRLFEQLGKCLASSWEMCFQEAKNYYDLHGDLKVPKRYVTENGIALGSWLLTQRRVRAGAVPGCLSREQIKKLDGIGMEWGSRIGKAWERGYLELVKYREENGHVDVPGRYVTEEGYPLGKFVANQRTAWKNSRKVAGKAGGGQAVSGEGHAGESCSGGDGFGTACTGRILSAQRERKLDALGFIWDRTQQNWNRYYEAAKEFYKQEGHLEVPVKYVTADGLRLGLWLRSRAAEKKALPPDQIKALEAIGMQFDSRYDTRWEERFQLAQEYYREHGNLEVPKEYVIQGVRLGRWVSAMRSARERPDSSHYRLDAERIRRLDGIGMRWVGDSWEARYRLAEQYYREHGDLKVSQSYIVETDEGRIWLGKWLAVQRKKRNGPGGKRDLTQEQEARLEAIGMEW